MKKTMIFTLLLCSCSPQKKLKRQSSGGGLNANKTLNIDFGQIPEHDFLRLRFRMGSEADWSARNVDKATAQVHLPYGQWTLEGEAFKDSALVASTRYCEKPAQSILINQSSADLFSLPMCLPNGDLVEKSSVQIKPQLQE